MQIDPGAALPDPGPVVVSDIVFDAIDPETLAKFWSQLLGIPLSGWHGPYFELESTGSAPRFVFQRVDSTPSGKNRVHVDLRVGDPRAMQRHVERLGGRRLSEYADGGFLVMCDPEGNEFCLIPLAGANMDDEGNAHYLDDA